MLLLGKVVPNGFGLEVIKNRGEATLEGFDLVVERLLKVKEWARSMTCTCVSVVADPYVGGVEVLEEVCGLSGVDGSESRGFGEASFLEPLEGVGPRGGYRGQVSNLQLDKWVGEK